MTHGDTFITATANSCLAPGSYVKATVSNQRATPALRLFGALLPLGLLTVAGACDRALDVLPDIASCGTELDARPFATTRSQRFLGKVTNATARCRGGSKAVNARTVPWTDWPNYWAAGDAPTKAWLPTKNLRGINGALIDLEYERVELIRFNLFDNSGTFPAYTQGVGAAEGGALNVWQAMRLPSSNANFREVGGAGTQVCRGDLVRARTLTGICNDIRNPLMGSSGTLFARNVEFESTFPDLSADSLVRNRHGGRISLLSPDPQVVSRRLLTRAQSDSASCADGMGQPGFAKTANCDYQNAPFMNVLAAFWIQFMTHDWFSHMEEGHNASAYASMGCATQHTSTGERALTADEARSLGCRPDDMIDRALVADSSSPRRFADGARERLSRAPRVFKNTNTAWWDASQLYGYDNNSRRRVKRDPADPARLQMVTVAAPSGARASVVSPSSGDAQGYLPLLGDNDPMLPDWRGQEAAAFADNWNIGLSFFHNVFAREHNQFVSAFRARQKQIPDADCGLRNPARPMQVIRYRDVTPDELFDMARLVVAAEIAKIHTIEWTTQLLYDEPLFRGMNANWGGLLHGDNIVTDALATVVRNLGNSLQTTKANTWYSVLASGPGIFGLGSHKDNWSSANVDDLNGGTNHFGSPFNFPEEFVSVYRLHSLVPDLLEYRQLAQPDAIASKIPAAATFRAGATAIMRDRGLANWALSMGRQRLGLLTLQNSPRFLQNLPMPRLAGATKTLDVVALDLLRDREHGVPRYNEFRRQFGLRQITSFDDFVDQRLARGSAERLAQERVVTTMRDVYGQHTCDATKTITTSQVNDDNSPINDCLGHAHKALVDNVEDLDNIVGYLAENTRPHGYAISETQFVVFVLNASRRLFSDRFFTSSFRPEFYSTLGVSWVTNNGPSAITEVIANNGHDNLPVSPLKRVLLRVMPELASELGPAVNAFDPWARDRGAYYSLRWAPRKGAERDEAFRVAR